MSESKKLAKKTSEPIGDVVNESVWESTRPPHSMTAAHDANLQSMDGKHRDNNRELDERKDEWGRG